MSPTEPVEPIGGAEPFNPEEAQYNEARAAFKGYLAAIGVEVVQDIIDAGLANQEKGRRGITVPTEDGSSFITVNETVSFQAGDYGPYRIHMDTAKAAIAEVREEAAQEQASPDPEED